VADGKWLIEGHYPTQAKGRLEWGTQHLLPGVAKLLGASPVFFFSAICYKGVAQNASTSTPCLALVRGSSAPL
jgi:hypothetical protein